MRIMLLGLLGALSLVGLSGCIFSPKPGDGKVPPQPTTYRIPAHPADVLYNLVRAYEAKDSVAYRKLFALNYEGSTYDTTSTGDLAPGTFHWIDEVKHIQAIAEDRTIQRIDVNLGVEGSWVRTSALGPNGEDWASITIPGPKLQIDYNNSDPSWLIRTGETFVYDFAPETPAPTSETDTLWTIGRWVEVGNVQSP